MAENVFRRTLRMHKPESADNIDTMLISHMENLEKESPHKLQEWMRHCLRSVFVLEFDVIKKEQHNLKRNI